MHLEQQSKGVRMLEEGQIFQAAGMSTPAWSNAWRKYQMFSQGGADPREMI
jgi:hypothetical protein